MLTDGCTDILCEEESSDDLDFPILSIAEGLTDCTDVLPRLAKLLSPDLPL